MQHGVKTKFHLIDWGWNYGETKWMASHWTRRGHTRYSRWCHFWKRWFVRSERRRGKEVTKVSEALLLLTLLWLPPHQVVAGPATAYWPGDGQCGAERADGKPFTRDDQHIAHRRLPLGTAGWVCSMRTHRCAWTVVLDHGPFGAVRPCAEDEGNQAGHRRVRYKRGCWHWRVLIRPRAGWHYRGEFDLTRPVAQAIGHRPFDRVVFYYWRPAKRRSLST